MSNLRPRRCILGKGSNGYGFHLHGEKGKTGQFIRLVEPDSPAATAGLFAGDRLTFVNGDNVEGESHQQVVARIRATAGSLELIVVDAETAEVLMQHNLECRKEYVTEGIPLPGSKSGHGDAAESEATATSAENGNISLQRLSVSAKDSKAELRPRLCSMKKGVTGYGFNLHSEKSKPGQYIRAVDEESPADKAGLKPQDKIVQVNSMSVVGMQHSEVVAAIKAGGDEASLLVVDCEAEAFFNSCNIIPTEAHLTAVFIVCVSSLQLDGKVAVKPKVSVSASTSSTTSTASLPISAASTPPPEVCPNASLTLSMSLAQAKERAHQKRSSKKAPAMDWSKRNELFSNL
uniref:Na(+)/H(+) exchange regulatory cofactor NHE-RF n=1 Tax=Hucho hucho TaxID=62062 RepID=A0A4W5QHL7_9TELE